MTTDTTLAPTLAPVAVPADSLAPVLAGPARKRPSLRQIALLPARDRRTYEADMSVADVIALRQMVAEQGPWQPACGGTETPFVARSGARLLYCWQPSTGRHAYLNCDTDMFLSAEEVAMHLDREPRFGSPAEVLGRAK